MVDNCTAGRLAALACTLEDLLDEVALELERAPSEVVTVGLEAQGDLVLAIDALKTQCKEGLRAINRATTRVHNHFCRAIVDAEQVPYKHPGATFSPHVDSEFSIADARALLDHLRVSEGLSQEDAHDRFIDLAQKKSERKRLCEAALENGQPLPEGMKGFSWAKVRIRRNRNHGQEKQSERGAEEEF